MDVSHLLAAGWVTVLHTIAAVGALVLGIVQLTAPKGTLPHRTLGYLWVGLMAAVTLTSVFIHNLAAGGGPNLFGFSWIHGFTLFVAIMLPVSVLAARRREISRHARGMIGLYVGGLVIAGAFTLVPGRVLHAVLFGAG
jgi:uncharacterized membrane protein